jgi:alanine racemase
VFRGTFAIVDLGAIRDNVAAIKSLLAEDTRVLVTVKANGYGHGALQASQAAIAGGATDLGVATVEEGVFLRKLGVQQPILVLGSVPANGAKVAAEMGLAVTLTGAWEQLPSGFFQPPLDVHLKVDTGMNRLGLRNADDLIRLVRWVNSRSDMNWAGMFTHLACADGESVEHAAGQIRKLEDILGQFQSQGLQPPLIHAANSAGTLRVKDWHYGMVRVGISAYGYPPADTMHVSIPLIPALNLYSFITRVDTIGPGDTVGYGATFTAKRTTRVATIPVGYADGYFRGLSNRASVVIHGQQAPVIGNVCMDQLMVDVTDLHLPHGVQAGDCATLYGHYAPDHWHGNEILPMNEPEQFEWLSSSFRNDARANPVLSLDTLANHAATISYELMCALSPRVPRIYV